MAEERELATGEPEEVAATHGKVSEADGTVEQIENYVAMAGYLFAQQKKTAG